MFILERAGAQARVLLDYVIPTYRDFRVARFFYREKAGYFHGQGIEFVRIRAGQGEPREVPGTDGVPAEGRMYVLDVDGGALKDAGM